jgi:hypothetical protein
MHPPLHGEGQGFESPRLHYIERDPDAARDIVRESGQTGVSVIKIGSRWIVGFDKEQIEKELARKAS